MNIKDAKTEIKNALLAYHRKDSAGEYLYPRIRQRPILLIGPPGIGKTAIMEQVAEECGVGLVAYTITHHTRQSAIGLPHIEHRTYAGNELTVTEYTMSEIIASVYECMEKSGCREGILFIDEINCVSETLAPAMLQFLQNKTFGSHAIPEGWMIVAAGNPPEYNKSVREFDIATLDRVRRIQVGADLEVWMEYARVHHVHPAITSYLTIYRDHFYLVENTAEGKYFVTARGWEDLSELLWNYEELMLTIHPELVCEYLQKEEVGRSFSSYYMLYCKYGKDYAVQQLLDEACPIDIWEERVKMAKAAGFDERLTVVELILDTLYSEMSVFYKEESLLNTLHQKLRMLKKYVLQKEDIQTACMEFIQEQRKQLTIREKADLIAEKEALQENTILQIMEENLHMIKEEYLHNAEDGFARIAGQFGELVERRQELVKKILHHIERAFIFTEECFGDGHELVLLVSGLARGEVARTFLSIHESEAFLKNSRKLLYREREKELQDACRSFLL